MKPLGVMLHYEQTVPIFNAKTQLSHFLMALPHTSNEIMMQACTYLPLFVCLPLLQFLSTEFVDE